MDENPEAVQAAVRTQMEKRAKMNWYICGIWTGGRWENGGKCGTV